MSNQTSALLPSFSISVGADESYFCNFSIKSLPPISYLHLRIRCSLISWKQHRCVQALNKWQQHFWTTKETMVNNNHKAVDGGFLSHPRGMHFLCGVTCRHSCVVTCVTCVRRMPQDLPASCPLLDKPHIDIWGWPNKWKQLHLLAYCLCFTDKMTCIYLPVST